MPVSPSGLLCGNSLARERMQEKAEQVLRRKIMVKIMIMIFRTGWRG